METKNKDDLVAVNAFCVNHNIDISFVSLLQLNGLIEISTIEAKHFIEKEKLPQLEKYVRFYYEMDINMEGIETITYLLERIENLQYEVTKLKNRLYFYEVH